MNTQTNNTWRSALASIPTEASSHGLLERTGTSKVGLKGPGVSAWLADRQLPWPANIYDVARDDAASIVVRIASNEVIAESPAGTGWVQQIEDALADRPQGVYRTEQQTTTLTLSGDLATAAWAQTCGVNLVDEPDDRIVYTRAAGITCGIIPESRDGQRAYRIWVDYGFSPDFVHSFAEILASIH